MTDKTATQNLTRTTSTDSPLLTADYLKTLAKEVDQRMAAQAYHLERSRKPPFAVVRLSTPQLFDANSFPALLPFDLVAEDTADMVDLSADPTAITWKRTGWYNVGGYVLCSGFGAANSDTTVFLGNHANSARDGLTGQVGLPISGLMQVSTLSQLPLSMQLTWFGSSTTSITTVSFAEMWAYWVRDL